MGRLVVGSEGDACCSMVLVPVVAVAHGLGGGLGCAAVASSLASTWASIDGVAASGRGGAACGGGPAAGHAAAHTWQGNGAGILSGKPGTGAIG